MCEKYQNSRYKLLPIALGYVRLISTELEAFVLLAVFQGLQKAHPIILLACWQQLVPAVCPIFNRSWFTFHKEKASEYKSLRLWLYYLPFIQMSGNLSNHATFVQSFYWIDISWNSNREFWAADEASVQFKWILTQKLYMWLCTLASLKPANL